MASEHRFDIIAKVDLTEVSNAIQQTEKELIHRYDLKDSNSELSLDTGKGILKMTSQDDFKLKAVYEIFKQKAGKRGISPLAFETGKINDALGGNAKQEIQIQTGLTQEQAKKITKMIKELKLKVSTQIQGDQVRVTGKKIDDLQAVMKAVREAEFDFFTQFSNLS